MTARLATIPTEAPRRSAKVKTVAELMDCDESQVRRLVGDGAIEAHRVGKRGIRIFLDSVAAYQENRGLEISLTDRPLQRERARASTRAHRAAVAELHRLGLV